MYFEGRELRPYSRPASPAKLREGEVYFSVNFVDDEMLIPVLEPHVFVGRNLEVGDSGQLYFQDIGSHRRGVVYGSDSISGNADFLLEGEESLYLFDFEGALEELMLCALRRKAKEPSLEK